MKKCLLNIIFLIISLMLFSCDLLEPLQYEGEEQYDNYYEKELIETSEINDIKETEQNIINDNYKEDENINSELADKSQEDKNTNSKLADKSQEEENIKSKFIDKIEVDDIYLEKKGENEIVVAFLPKDKNDKIKVKAREIVEYFHNIENEADLYEIEKDFSDFNIKKHNIIYLGFDGAKDLIEKASPSDIDYLTGLPDDIINFLISFDFSDKTIYTFSSNTTLDDIISSKSFHK